MILSQGRLNRIDKKKLTLDTLCSNCSVHCTLVAQTLERDATENSYLLEENRIMERDWSHREKRKHKPETSETREHLFDAWNYAKRHFEGYVDFSFLLTLGQMIEPEKNPGGFRRTQALWGRDMVMTSPDKIERDLGVALRRINQSSIHPVERGVLYHLHIARVQPFNDGNKRLARLIQNALLEYEGYGATIIPVQERETYMKRIVTAVHGYRERESAGKMFDAWEMPLVASKEEFDFLDYLAQKVSDTLDLRLSKAETFPGYEITLNPRIVVPTNVQGAARRLNTVFKSRGDVGQVRVIDQKEGIIGVYGNIGIETIQRSLDKVPTFRGRYSIKRVQ